MSHITHKNCPGCGQALKIVWPRHPMGDIGAVSRSNVCPRCGSQIIGNTSSAGSPRRPRLATDGMRIIRRRHEGEEQ